MNRRLSGLIALLATAVSAPAYYHFNFYVNGVAAPQKFDLSALPNKTVTFYVSSSGPAVFNTTDSFGSVLGQIRQAAAAWNAVPTSDLRVEFGGLENASTPQNTAGGDVVFDDLPPGVLGYGGPTASLAPVTTAGGAPFIPVTRSVIRLNRNLTALPGPSYNESFFLTVVHEMGHALGLQHTFTSSAMSQAKTRGTTVSRPIEADDAAGLSLLYPNAEFARQGAITGRITAGGQGVHLASVVAIRTGFGAVSALTAPDGTFRIAGIPPGPYFVYVHSLPADADILGPWNADGSLVPATGPVGSVFYPGTVSLQQAQSVSVQTGRTTEGINIAVTRRASLPLSGVVVYSYFNTTAVKPAYVNMLAAPQATLAAAGEGLAAPGVSAQFLGSSAYLLPGGVRPYQASGVTYLALDVGFGFAAQSGQHHLIVSTPDYMHVLPSGINLTQKNPPTVSSAVNNGDGSVTVTGANWAADTALYFDGLPATVSSLDPRAGTAVVTPPPAASGQTAVVSAYNTDGQSSQFLQSASPVRYSFGALAPATITAISPSSLPAGAEATVEIQTSGFSFPATPIVGFGSTDIVVRRVFNAGPNRLLVNVSVSAAAALSSPDVSVISGFQVANAPSAFQISPLIPGLPSPVPVLRNTTPNLTGAYPGAQVSLSGSVLTAAGGTLSVTLNGQPVSILSATPNQIFFTVPPSLNPGLAALVVNNGLATSLPVTVNIDSLPASIVAVTNNSGAAVDNLTPTRAGDLVTLTLTGFAPAGTTPAGSRVQVLAGGARAPALQVLPGTQSGTWQVSFLVPATAATGAAQQVIVYLDERSSYPAVLPIARPDGVLSLAPPQEGS